MSCCGTGGEGKANLCDKHYNCGKLMLCSAEINA